MAEQSKTVDTALTLLRLVADRQGATTASLARDLVQSRSAVGRMLVTLESHGFARRTPHGWVAGLGLLALAAGVEPELRALARTELEGLAERFGETAVLTVRDGDEAVAVDQVVGRAGVLQVNYRTGTRHPLTVAASGRALLDPGAVTRVRGRARARGPRRGRGRAGHRRPADRQPGRRGPGPPVPARRRGGRRAAGRRPAHRRRPGRQRPRPAGRHDERRTPCRTTDASVRCRPSGTRSSAPPTGASTPRS